ncbi:MAG: hypothetical protein CK530_01230 [Planctomycetaceae bacterium]|nr:MAG: hypothetical protein CK530_01230 [Planctomycetaceae bacterium]
MVDDEIRSFVSKNTWRFAKTMPTLPHWYALRVSAIDEQSFVQFVKEIRSRGTRRRYGGREYLYLDVDGFEYWTMGAPIGETILINRAKILEK